MFHLRRRRAEQDQQDGEWGSLVKAIAEPKRAAELDEESFREYVQRHVLAGSSFEEQASRQRRRRDAQS